MPNNNPVWPDGSGGTVNVLQSLNYSGTQPDVTNRVVATKAALLAMTKQNLKDNYPGVYEVICLEDGQGYRVNQYDNEATPNDQTGYWNQCDPIEVYKKLATEGVMGEVVTATSELGYISVGDQVPADYTWQDVIKMITTPYTPPTIEISSSTTGVMTDPDGNLWAPANIPNAATGNISVTTEVTKGTNDIETLRLTLGDGIVPFSGATLPASTDVTATSTVDLSQIQGSGDLIATVNDGRRTVTETVTIDKTGAAIYCGIDGVMQSEFESDPQWEVDPDAMFAQAHPYATYYTEAHLEALQQLTKNTTATAADLSTVSFTIAENGPDSSVDPGPATNYFVGTVVVAIPKVFGTVQSVKFGPFNYDDISIASTTVRGLDYWAVRINGVSSDYSGTVQINLAT